jgi:copper chaperone CopZ
MLPVFGQAPPEPETIHEETGACSDACCSENAADAGAVVSHTLRTRESNQQAQEGSTPRGGLARTVVRVEGMDCASCAATVEKQVGRLPRMHRAVVNFAAGRLDAEHDRDLDLQEIEKVVRGAGYGVGSTREAEVTRSGAPPGRSRFWSLPYCSPSAWRWVLPGRPRLRE